MTEAAIRYLPSLSPSWRRNTDVIIVGAGASGLSAAIDTSRRGYRVMLVCKGELRGGSTLYAQGGLAVVSEPGDSFDSHLDDTMTAGAGIAEALAVRQLVTEAPGVVRYLAELGARFDVGSPGLEGGHSHRRIIHSGGDAIGKELHRVLSRAALREDIEVLEHTVAIDLLRDESGRAMGITAGQRGLGGQTLSMGEITARAVVMATGGFGQAYTSTTNPVEVTGDGLALAARAGASLTNLEFVQFHPTVLYVRGQRGQSSLLTEALRGAGATIVDDGGTPIMRGRHERGDLAPRDVVSLAMFERMHASANPLENLWLDARRVSSLNATFPTVVELARKSGFDAFTERLPIAPGAHYACGGVRADFDGRTSIQGLYAIGEVAATGVHGANRLASNSLTEAVIAGRRVARCLDAAFDGRSPSVKTRHHIEPLVGDGVASSSRASLAETMSSHVGVVRDRDGLAEALEVVDQTPASRSATLDFATLEATNLHTVTLLVAYAASLREESRGCHHRSDFPNASRLQNQPLTLAVVEGLVGTRVHEMSST